MVLLRKSVLTGAALRVSRSALLRESTAHSRSSRATPCSPATFEGSVWPAPAAFGSMGRPGGQGSPTTGYGPALGLRVRSPVKSGPCLPCIGQVSKVLPRFCGYVPKPRLPRRARSQHPQGLEHHGLTGGISPWIDRTSRVPSVS